MPSRLLTTILILATASATSATAREATGPESTPSAALLHDYVRILNVTTPLESAASHGTAGFTVGAGATNIQAKEFATQLSNRQEAGTRNDLDESRFLPQIWITKGIFWPVDLGLNYAQASEYRLKRLAGYLQWTIFQEFLQPALAMRVDYSRLTAEDLFEATTSSISAICSWGYGPVTLLASAAFGTSTTAISAYSPLSVGLNEMEIENRDTQLNIERHYSYGLRFQIPNTLVAVSLEKTVIPFKGDVIAGKLSINM